MPTARELLEQADALMRRNRANTLDDIPVLMDAVPAAAVATPRTDVPVADRGPPSVPLLTEDIDVVDEDATLGTEAVEGEPSAWLEFDDANPSVIGDAPDSIAIVPPVEIQATPPDEVLLASAEHEEIEFTLPAEESTAAQMPGDVPATAYAAVPAEIAAENLAKELPEAWPEIPAVMAAIEPTAGAEAEAAEEPAALAVQEAFAVAPADTTPVIIEPAISAPMVTAPAMTSPVFAAAPSPLHADAPAMPVVAAGLAALAATAPAAVAAAAPAPTPVPAPAAPAMVDDDERWAAAAEEIRMQVLQRIDLFTDAGLRDQLAQRLQPIADRASADFVKAINLHVGDLLRTYVAEAIEREIERWRRDH
jgi:hypothetical protein